MEQRDYLKDQIEQLGKVLGQIVANFLGLKTSGEPIKAIETSREALKDELDIDVPHLITLEKNDLQVYLEGKKLTSDHFQTLSDYLKEAGETLIEKEPAVAKQHLIKSIELLELADENSNAISFENIAKKQAIQNQISEKLT